MYRGFRKDQVKTPVIRRLWKPIQQLKRIRQTGSDCLRRDGGQGSIEIPATAAQTLPHAAEPYAGNAEQRRSQIGDRHDLRPRGLEDTEIARYEFGAVPDADNRKFMNFGNDFGQQNTPSRGQRVVQQQVSGNLIILGSVEDDSRGSLIEVGFENPKLHPPRSGCDKRSRQATSAIAEDFAQIFLVVRHAHEPWREGV